MKGNRIGVGVVGLGRSGYNIHLKALARQPERYRIAAVADGDSDRLAATAAEFGCKAYPDLTALLADPDVALVVVATPSRYHTENVIQTLDAGRHAICEKPFGLSVADADAMIGAAKKAGRTLAPFHNLRFDQSFNTVRDVLSSGALGRILHIRVALHSFGRRWDWQTLRAMGGGQLTNNGSHMLDLAMALQELSGVTEPDDLELFADLRRALGSGDTEDHARLTLRSRTLPDAPTVDVEVTSACAYPQDRYLAMGTLGGLHGTTKRVEWKWVDPMALPDRPLLETSTADRSYNSEPLPWQSAAADCDDSHGLTHDRFYESLYDTLTAGAPLVVTPEAIRRRVAIVERAVATFRPA